MSTLIVVCLVVALFIMFVMVLAILYDSGLKYRSPLLPVLYTDTVMRATPLKISRPKPSSSNSKQLRHHLISNV